MAARSFFVVVAFRVSLSASLAAGGKWRTGTQQPRKAATMCTDRRMIDAQLVIGYLPAVMGAIQKKGIG
jgi:hypothetical protein